MNADTVLIIVVVFLALLFLASTIAAIFTKHLVSWYLSLRYSRLNLWLNRHYPELSNGWVTEELTRGMSDSKKLSIFTWLVRISAIIIVLASAFFLFIIFGGYIILR
jgi:hypothetical protein